MRVVVLFYDLVGVREEGMGQISANNIPMLKKKMVLPDCKRERNRVKTEENDCRGLNYTL